MAKMDERKPKQGKIGKKSKSKNYSANEPNNEQEGIKKRGIFSALDMIDSKSKEETREIEGKLRAGLIKSEKAEKIEKIKKQDINLKGIKNKIANLRKIKKEHINKGRFEEAIEISNKIITLAFSNNLKEIINEEKQVLEFIKKNRYQEPETIETLENKEELSSIKPTIPSKQVIEELKPRKDQDKEEFDEKSQKFMEEKEEFNQEKLKLEEEKEAFQWEKQMLEEVKKYERGKEKEIDEIDDFKKFEQEKEDLVIEKAKFEEEKLDFEEIKKIFHQDKLKFEEEKDTFKWEKEMFEEMKKHERNKEKRSETEEK